MGSLCNCKELVKIKVEADIGSDPLWCKVCGFNLDIDKMEISHSLKIQLRSWIIDYGVWINWDFDTLIVGGENLEKQHNETGLRLTEKVMSELKNKKIVFQPSSMFLDSN
ncbi:hypothetical protein ACIQXI_08380 [Lysinibacillus sp. NPDC097195]|uniref:hypothetical protein n=1 Tax=Lysinibacillus sp. NPDC097195 TaxID=3364141 RepID=UPI00380EE842